MENNRIEEMDVWRRCGLSWGWMGYEQM